MFVGTAFKMYFQSQKVNYYYNNIIYENYKKNNSVIISYLEYHCRGKPCAAAGTADMLRLVGLLLQLLLLVGALPVAPQIKRVRELLAAVLAAKLLGAPVKH